MSPQRPGITKLCRKCKIRKSVERFCKNKRMVDGFDRICRSCKSKANKKYYPKGKSGHKDARLQRMYGISLDDFNDMYEEQRGVCKLCGAEGKTKGLSVDHCHKTGRVRGLLCISCNTFLGKIESNPSLLSNITGYLK